MNVETSPTRRALVVGAGIAGSTLAVSLERQGFDVELAEIQDVWKPVGTGLTLLGPTLRALRTVGLIDRAVSEGAGLNRLVVGNERTEALTVSEPPRLNGPEYPAFVQLSRPAFHGILADAVWEAGIPVRLGVTVSTIEDGDGDVGVTFTNGDQASYDMVVGADGIHSTVRELTFPEAEPPHRTGQAVWRAMVDRSDGLDASVSLGAMYMFYGPRNKTLALPTSDHQVYIALVENLEDRTRPSAEQLPELLREHLSDYSGFLATLRDEIVEPSQVTWRELEVLLLPSPWYRGRVILIGDAAHATTPHLASGAGIAIEDAIVLAEELAPDGPVQAAFERFMTRRYERCRMVVENSEQLGEWEQRPVPDADPAGLIAHSWATLDEPI